MEDKRALLLLGLVCLLTIPAAIQRILKNPDAQIYSDAEGYFWYLPAVFSNKDPLTYPAKSFLLTATPQGDSLNKYTCGVAYFELPGYLIASAVTGGWERTEKSIPTYSITLGITGVLTTFFGLYLLLNFLRRYFSTRTALITVLLTFAGTNLFHYTTFEMGMSHIYSFTLFSAVLWLAPHIYNKPTTAKAILAGVLIGWITLIRPTNIVALLPLLFFDVQRMKDLLERAKFYRKHAAKLIPAVAAGTAIVFPQLLYWKAETGNWITYSYSGEGFKYWADPKILEVLFDTQNGLFTYSPLALLMVAGIIQTTFSKRHMGWVNLLIFALITYSFASWWAWWYGGAFGHRCYVEYFAFFTLPLGHMIEKITRLQRRAIRYSMYLTLFALCYYSIGMSYLYRECYAPWDGPDWVWNYDRLWWLITHLYPKL